MSEVTIKLSEPIRGHGGAAITELLVREPRFSDYRVVGDTETRMLSLLTLSAWSMSTRTFFPSFACGTLWR
jgi:hypothetical protein